VPHGIVATGAGRAERKDIVTACVQTGTEFKRVDRPVLADQAFDRLDILCGFEAQSFRVADAVKVFNG